MKIDKNFKGGEPLLYLVATPIGNLKELSPRAIDILSNSDYIACEDTRNTRQLLSFFNTHKELFSLREHNEIQTSEYLIKLLKEGKKISYVSDAGYPSISDPGYLLVNECLKNNVKVSVVNGSSAFLSALIPSGIITNHFLFYGFLKSNENEASEELKSLVAEKYTLIFYESPHRIQNTIQMMFNILGDRKAVIARELTKINEEFIRGSLNELMNLDYSTIKGEIVIVVDGLREENTQFTDEEIFIKYRLLVDKGLSNKDATEILSTFFNINKNKIKSLILSKKDLNKF